MIVSSQRRRLYDVVGVLFRKSLKVRYRGSLLGIVWSAVNPLGMAIVYAAIFGHTFLPYYDGSLVRYVAAVYVGLTLARFFVSGTSDALLSIVQNGALLNKVRVPFEAFPLATLAAYGYQQVVGTLPVILALGLFLGHAPLHLLALVVPLAGLTMLATGVALLVSGAEVYFRDMPYLYELATFFIWVTSPVFYPAGIVPPNVLALLAINPLFPILETVRTLVLTDAWPPAPVFGRSLFDGALALAVGALAFRAMRPQFMDLL